MEPDGDVGDAADALADAGADLDAGGVLEGLFALGRLPGWIAQWKEMVEDPEQKIGRPRQLFVGATRRDVLKAFVFEYLLLGAATGVIAAVVGGAAAWAVSVHESGSAPSTCFTSFNSARSRVFVMVQRVLVPLGTTIWSRPLGFTPLVQTQEPV